MMNETMGSRRKSRRYEDSSESESEDEAISFKRSKKSNGLEAANGRKQITFDKETHGVNGIQKVTITNGTKSHGSTQVGRVGSVDVVDTVDSPLRNRVAPVNPNKLPDLDPSPSNIMSLMGMEKGKGFAKFMKTTAPPKKTFSIEKFDEKINDLGFTEADIALEAQEVVFEEEVSWIPPDPPRKLEPEVFDCWRKIGPTMTSTDVNATFVDPNILKEVKLCKEIFHKLEEDHYQSVRARANVFERIGKGPFICRAAMKMANLDSVVGFSLTDPKTQSGSPVVGPNDLFYFADVCAGPGGFTEYVLFKKKWEAKGFGLTLKGHLDFNTADFVAAEPESFEAYYGPANDGNIYNPENVAGYLRHVLCSTDKKGVHLMMADGGFSVTKQEHMQEILSGQIILSQCLVAIGVVRAGGHFVCKLFDIFTPFSVGLIYLMHLAFDLVSIHKPNTSRPANSERYLICKWKRERTEALKGYLENCHRLMWEFSIKKQEETILEVVPISILANVNNPFFKYIWDSNNSMGKKQVQSLKKMIHFVRDPTLESEEQLEAKLKSFELWGIPSEITKPAQPKSTDKMFAEILESYPASLVRNPEKDLTPDTLDANFVSPYDWRFVVVEAVKGSNNRGFFLAMGRDKVYRYDGHSWILWTSVTDEKLELASKTLVYGEVAEEVHGRMPTQNVFNAFHIIDAVMVGGQDIRNLHYTQRHEICVKFAKAMNKSVQGILPVRVKNPVRMENVADVIGRLSQRVIRKRGVGSKLVCPIDHTDETSPVIQPAGLLFIKITKDPWQMALNREANRKYWFNKNSGKATHAVPEDAIANFFWTMHNRVIWWWDKQTNATVAHMEVNDPRIHLLSAQRVHAFSLSNHIMYTLRCPPQVVVSPEKKQ